MQKLESLLMVSGKVICEALVGPEPVKDRLKMIKHLRNRLPRLLGEILIFTPVSLKQTGLDLGCPLKVICEGSPDLMCRRKMAHTLELSIPNSSKQHVDCLVVCIVLVHLKRCSTLLGNHIGSILGNIPYFATLAQQIRFHARLPIIVAKDFQRWGFARMRHGHKRT